MVRIPDSVADIARAHQEILESGGLRDGHGAFYTPLGVVDRLVDIAISDRIARVDSVDHTIRVLDPSCGTGNFLIVVALRIARRLQDLGVPTDDSIDHVVRNCVHGVDVDPRAVDLCRQQLSALTAGRVPPDELVATIRVADWLLEPIRAAGFDVVIGNPPFLDQQARATTSTRERHDKVTGVLGARRARISRLTNPAAVFLLRSLDSIVDDGVVAMVQPVSFLTARGTGGVRQEIADTPAAVDVWITRDLVFDAAVHVCAVVVDRARPAAVNVHLDGSGIVPHPVDDLRGPTWAFAAADLHGVPSVVEPRSGCLGDVCDVTADFRDQYYGLVGHVHDETDPDEDSMRLVTTGLIDPFTCSWGAHGTRFARSAYSHPVVRPADLPAPMREWAETRAVPKVLVATQTRVLEAVADSVGGLLPSVPVLTIVPNDSGDLWRVLAMVMSPVTSVIAARRHLGAGLSSDALKMAASDIAALPLPVDDDSWNHGALLAERLQAGESRDLATFGLVMCRAHGLGGRDAERIMEWWIPRVSRSRPARASGL